MKLTHRLVATATSAGLVILSTGGLVACGTQTDATDGTTPAAVTENDGENPATSGKDVTKTSGKTATDEKAGDAVSDKVIPPVEIDAEDIGLGARIVRKVTLTEPTEVRALADMTEGDLGFVIQRTSDNEHVWEDRLGGDDEMTATIDAGEYYVVGVGGRNDARGTVTVESVD